MALECHFAERAVRHRPFRGQRHKPLGTLLRGPGQSALELDHSKHVHCFGHGWILPYSLRRGGQRLSFATGPQQEQRSEPMWPLPLRIDGDRVFRYPQPVGIAAQIEQGLGEQGKSAEVIWVRGQRSFEYLDRVGASSEVE
jgi:hypothetical protein